MVGKLQSSKFDIETFLETVLLAAKITQDQRIKIKIRNQHEEILHEIACTWNCPSNTQTDAGPRYQEEITAQKLRDWLPMDDHFKVNNAQ